MKLSSWLTEIVLGKNEIFIFHSDIIEHGYLSQYCSLKILNTYF